MVVVWDRIAIESELNRSRFVVVTTTILSKMFTIFNATGKLLQLSLVGLVPLADKIINHAHLHYGRKSMLIATLFLTAHLARSSQQVFRNIF